VREYFRLLGISSSEEGVWNIDDTPMREEVENAFVKIDPAKNSSGFVDKPAIQMNGKLARKKPCRILHFKMDASRVHEIARAHGATVTAYMLMQMFYACSAATDELRGDINVQVPVNMRKFYPTKTVRNFSMYCGIRIPIECIGDKQSLIAEINRQLLEKSDIQITEALIAEVFDKQLTSMISYIVIIGILCVGIFTKLFDALSAKLAEDISAVASWRFMTSSIFAYFYIILMILLIFTSAHGGVIGIAVSNLYNIFLVVYAYVGFNFVLALVATRMKPTTAVIVLIVVILLAMSIALQFLSMVGVLFTIRKNRELTPRED
jgi:hypothetical protein